MKPHAFLFLLVATIASRDRRAVAAAEDLHIDLGANATTPSTASLNTLLNSARSLIASLVPRHTGATPVSAIRSSPIRKLPSTVVAPLYLSTLLELARLGDDAELLAEVESAIEEKTEFMPELQQRTRVTALAAIRAQRELNASELDSLNRQPNHKLVTRYGGRSALRGLCNLHVCCAPSCGERCHGQPVAGRSDDCVIQKIELEREMCSATNAPPCVLSNDDKLLRFQFGREYHNSVPTAKKAWVRFSGVYEIRLIEEMLDFLERVARAAEKLYPRFPHRS